MEEIIFQTLKEDSKQRLDKFLVSKLIKLKPEFSRSRIQNLITSGCVFDGKHPLTGCDYKIKGGEHLVIKIPAATESEILAKDIPFEIVLRTKICW